MQRSSIPAAHTSAGILTSASPRGRNARQQRRLLFDSLVTLVLVVASFLFYISGIDKSTTPFHQDESRWLNRAHYLPDLIDPFGPTWNDQYLTRGQPPVGSYMMGLGMLIQGRDYTTNRAYDFRRSWDFNVQNGMIPGESDLLAGRRWNSLLGAIAVGIVYLIVRSLTNPVGGIVGALFLVADPLQTWHNRLALADTTLTLTLALLILVVIRLMRRPSWPLALVAGVLIGLGGANKFTPLALAVPLGGLGALLLIRSWFYRRSIKSRLTPGIFGFPPFRDLGWMLLSTPITALGTFVLVYPYLWPAPIDRTMKLLQFRRDEMANQYRLNPKFQVDNPVEGIRKTLHALGSGKAWSATHNVLHGIGLNSVGLTLAPLDLSIGIIGLLVLAYVGLRKGLRSAELLTVGLIAFQAATIILSMRVDFERYYLPMVLGEMIALGCAVGYATDLLNRLVLRMAPRRRPAVPVEAEI